jgi:hypothetical protein
MFDGTKLLTEVISSPGYGTRHPRGCALADCGAPARITLAPSRLPSVSRKPRLRDTVSTRLSPAWLSISHASSPPASPPPPARQHSLPPCSHGCRLLPQFHAAERDRESGERRRNDAAGELQEPASQPR